MPCYYHYNETKLLLMGVQSHMTRFSVVEFNSLSYIGKINSEAYRNAERSACSLGRKYNHRIIWVRKDL